VHHAVGDGSGYLKLIRPQSYHGFYQPPKSPNLGGYPRVPQ
jgi:hypothetical protein